MKIILYSDEYKDELEKMLLEFSREVYGYNTANIDDFVEYHWAIYLCINNKGIVTGFSAFMFNQWFGLRPSTMGNTYIYVKPEYRGGRTMYLFSKQTLKVAIENDIELEHYYASGNSGSIGKRMLKGEKMYDTYVYGLETCKSAIAKLDKKNKRIYK